MAQNLLFNLKKIGIKILVAVLDGLVHFKKILNIVLTWTVWKPMRWLCKTVLFSFIIKFYRIALFIKIQWWDKIYAPVKIKIIHPLTRRYVTHSVIAMITIFSITSNISAKEASLETVEQIGQKSILFTLAYREDMENFVQETTELTGTKTTTTTNYLSPDIGGMVTANTGSGETEEDLPIATISEDSALLSPNLPSTSLNVNIRSKVIEYIVEEGDVISTIAEKFSLRVNTILWANKLTDNDMIRPGDKLLILPTDGVLHKVKKGDTIEKIAKYYSSASDKIIESNALANANDLIIDEYLIVPDGKVPPPPASAPKPFSRLASRNVFKIPSSSPSSSKKGMVWPTSGKVITQYFGWRHSGLDIDGDYSSPIYAAEAGTITYAGWGRGYGLHVKMSHGNGVETVYGHLSKLYVEQGDSVTKGQTLGVMGTTGWSTGTHLHFEVRISGKRVNPLDYL
jgi:LysM repeat protein